FSNRWGGGSNNDPDIFDYLFNSNRFPPNGANRGRYSNPEIDTLVAIGRREVDVDKRRQAYSRIQQIIAEDLPYVSLWYWDSVAVFNKRLQVAKLKADGNYEFLTQVSTTNDHFARR